MNNEQRRIAVFDFDGTITTKDTFLEFVRYAVGNLSFLMGFFRFLPQLTAYKLHLYPNWKVKEKLFSHFFLGMSLKEFNTLCEIFFQSKGKSILREDAIRTIQKHLNQGDTVSIVSASISNWIRPFGKFLGVQDIIGTEISTDSSGNLTGNFLTCNCYGIEKVKRIKQQYPDYDSYIWIVYGDSIGDKELLDFANEKHYKFFT